MENQETNTEVLSRPEGVEVKLSAKGINIVAFIGGLFLLLVGTLLFVYIWGEFSAYGVGYEIGDAAKKIYGANILFYVVLLFIAYIFLQAGILYWFSGKDRKLFRWLNSWTAMGFYLTCPIALKYYRISLLLPGILVGAFPAIHGFCTGNASIFYIGLCGIISASADITFWYKLRAFDDEDLLQLRKDSGFQATIIKRNYGKG